MVCPHCRRYTYQIFDGAHELAHLLACEAYQNLPVAEVVDGKEFYRDRQNPNILVQIVRPS